MVEQVYLWFHKQYDELHDIPKFEAANFLTVLTSLISSTMPP